MRYSRRLACSTSNCCMSCTGNRPNTSTGNIPRMCRSPSSNTANPSNSCNTGKIRRRSSSACRRNSRYHHAWCAAVRTCAAILAASVRARGTVTRCAVVSRAACVRAHVCRLADGDSSTSPVSFAPPFVAAATNCLPFSLPACLSAGDAINAPAAKQLTKTKPLIFMTFSPL